MKLVFCTVGIQVTPPPPELAEPDPTFAHALPLALSNVPKSVLKRIEPALAEGLLDVPPVGTINAEFDETISASVDVLLMFYAVNVPDAV